MSERSRTKVLALVAESVKGCPHFGEWDWCNDNCDLYDFCDGVYVSQNPTKVGSDR